MDCCAPCNVPFVGNGRGVLVHRGPIALFVGVESPGSGIVNAVDVFTLGGRRRGRGSFDGIDPGTRTRECLLSAARLNVRGGGALFLSSS